MADTPTARVAEMMDTDYDPATDTAALRPRRKPERTTDRIRARREQLGLTREQVAERIRAAAAAVPGTLGQGGAPRRAHTAEVRDVAQWEGESHHEGIPAMPPSGETMPFVAQALETTVAELRGEKPTTSSPAPPATKMEPAMNIRDYLKEQRLQPGGRGALGRLATTARVAQPTLSGYVLGRASCPAAVRARIADATGGRVLTESWDALELVPAKPRGPRAAQQAALFAGGESAASAAPPPVADDDCEDAGQAAAGQKLTEDDKPAARRPAPPAGPRAARKAKAPSSQRDNRAKWCQHGCNGHCPRCAHAENMKRAAAGLAAARELVRDVAQETIAALRQGITLLSYVGHGVLEPWRRDVMPEATTLAGVADQLALRVDKLREVLAIFAPPAPKAAPVVKPKTSRRNGRAAAEARAE